MRRVFVPVKPSKYKTLRRAKQLRKDMTDAEHVLWSYLNRRQMDGHHFRKQHSIGPYVADFACVKSRLVIEVDGFTHTSDFELAHDKKRDAYMKSLGWKILRFWNEDIYRDIDSVLGEIIDTISSTTCGGGGFGGVAARDGGGAEGV